MVKKIGMKQGLIWGAALIVYGLIYRVASLDSVSWTVWLFYILAAVCALFAQRSYAAAVEGPSFGGKFGVGTLCGLIATALYAIYVFVYNRFVDDSLIQKILAAQQDALQARGGSPEVVAQQMERVEALFTPGPFAVLIFVQLFVIALVAALVGAFIFGRKKA